MSSKPVLIFLGVLLCSVDAGRVRRDEWSGGLSGSVTNGRPSLTGNLGYKNGGFDANGHYTKTFGGSDSWGGNVGYNKGGFSSGLDYSGTKGYDRLGASVGYQKGNFNVKGSGWRDSMGGWGAGASLSYRWKRSLEMQKDAFVLRVEADPCQFMLYDRNFDGVITGEEVHEIFLDENLADGLFKNLDSNDDGKVTAKEFETAKVHVIVGCAPRAAKE